jgi:WD repeat-containing protein 68
MADSFDGPRRVPTFPRQPEELHIPGGNTLPPQNGPRPGPSQFPSAPEFGASLPPSISIQHSAAQAGQYPAGSNAGSAFPGTLQPGHMNRLSGNPAPSLPTLPQLSTQNHQPSPPSKSIPQSRGYSKSSPAGFEQQQMYKNAGSTPDSGKYISPSSMGFGLQTPQSTPYSPLGLSDIRPLMDSVDDTLSPIGQNNGGLQFPTNSNYLAPWGVYALDWCKWPTRPNSPSAGKVALGSYLEDHHNYVSLR